LIELLDIFVRESDVELLRLERSITRNCVIRHVDFDDREGKDAVIVLVMDFTPKSSKNRCPLRAYVLSSRRMEGIV